MGQKSLDNFGYSEKIEPSRSVKGTNHVVSWLDGKVYCTCKGFRYGGECFHSRGEVIKALGRKLDYVLKQEVSLSRAHFKSLEEVMDWMQWNGSAENELFKNIALQLARSLNKVDADMIHYTLGEEVTFGKKGIGSALKGLEKQGYLEIVGRKKSERKVTHGRSICIFVLTDAGRELFNGGMK